MEVEEKQAIKRRDQDGCRNLVGILAYLVDDAYLLQGHSWQPTKK